VIRARAGAAKAHKRVQTNDIRVNVYRNREEKDPAQDAAAIMKEDQGRATRKQPSRSKLRRTVLKANSYGDI
jgi:hypothetical protein